MYSLYGVWQVNAIAWASAIHHLMVVCHVGRLYTYLRRWKFWSVVWENKKGVHFRAVWKNTAHVQGIRCSPKGAHLISWTSAVFSNTVLKWALFAYLITLRILYPISSYCLLTLQGRAADGVFWHGIECEQQVQSLYHPHGGSSPICRHESMFAALPANICIAFIQRRPS